ncbi:PEPxxWA-CTERM sorting domain-containing protein [Sphingomonas sp. CLY1604]|uniref:PEPxxWA-CTERM sorting domain-containing protein n=1 Tax=Sphingomonas sp. CLY1604 TaxID=3457786 RepID=UPI003FD872BE
MNKVCNAVCVAIGLLSAGPALAATTITSVAANGTNHLAVPGATVNMTFDQEAGTAFEANSKGLIATLIGPSASRTVVTPNGTTPYGAYAYSPTPYDGNGYFAVGAAPSSLTLAGMGGQLFSSISFFVGTLDNYNLVDLLDASGNVIQSFDGTQMYNDPNGAAPPRGNAQTSDINRRVTFTGTNGTAYNGIRFSNIGNGNQSFEFDNVSFSAAVPEPATWAMMIIGFGMLGGAMRYRRKSSKAAYA